MPGGVKRVERALARAGDVAVELVRQGRLEEATRLTLDAVREAMAPLAASVAQLTEDVADLRESVAKLTEDVNYLMEDGRRLHEEVERLARSVSELRESVADLKEMVVKHEGGIRENNMLDELEREFERITEDSSDKISLILAAYEARLCTDGKSFYEGEISAEELKERVQKYENICRKELLKSIEGALQKYRNVIENFINEQTSS